MQKDEAMTKVLEIIGPFSKNQEAIKAAAPSTRILEDLGVNSARLVYIILAFEDEFSIEVDDAAADKIRTLGDAVDMIVQKTGN